MEFGIQLILIGAGLIFVSIFAGLISSRIGAPLLLVFLGLGMLAGEDGPGGLDFDNFAAAYMIGAIALAVVLFDGGLRTPRETLRLALSPALVLATIGVVITAAITAAAAHAFLDLGPLESFLVGAIMASTDAAAVFFLLNLQGTNLVRRVSATLEAESGLNDPMAVFLTVTCVELLAAGVHKVSGDLLAELAGVFLLQIAGGAVLGLAGGLVLVRLVNALRLATGLYPILVLSGALLLFAGAQTVGASGFLAVYLAGLVLGNRRHRATQIIDRFQDGVAWLAHIVMFLMLGLLVTPSRLVDAALPALAIAAVLIVFARPAAVLLCLAPFGFTWRERGFISWVGLRGAVPIFLGTVPVLAGLQDADLYFEIAFVVVFTSLLIQGWTVNLTARRLNLALPPRAEPPQRFDLDLPAEVGHDMAAYTVQETSAAAGRSPADMALGGMGDVVAVIRDGTMRQPAEIGRLAPGDYVVVITAADRIGELDSTFGRKPAPHPSGRDEAVLGEFAFAGATKTGELVRLYDVQVPAAEHDLTLDAFLRRHLRDEPMPGDRLRLGEVELIVREVEDGSITQVGIELDPYRAQWAQTDFLRIWARHWLRMLTRLLGRSSRSHRV